MSLLFQPTPELKITPRVVYQKVEAGGFNREDRFIIFNNEFRHRRRHLDQREQYLLFREKFRDETLLADLVASYDFGPVELTSVTQLCRSRHPGQPRRFGAHGLRYHIRASGPDIVLPSNLRDTTKLKQFTQEVRLASTGSGPFQWVFGGFLTNIDRKYEQRLPTPG